MCPTGGWASLAAQPCSAARARSSAADLSTQGGLTCEAQPDVPDGRKPSGYGATAEPPAVWQRCTRGAPSLNTMERCTIVCCLYLSSRPWACARRGLSCTLAAVAPLCACVWAIARFDRPQGARRVEAAASCPFCLVEVAKVNSSLWFSLLCAASGISRVLDRQRRWMVATESVAQTRMGVKASC